MFAPSFLPTVIPSKTHPGTEWLNKSVLYLIFSFLCQWGQVLTSLLYQGRQHWYFLSPLWSQHLPWFRINSDIKWYPLLPGKSFCVQQGKWTSTFHMNQCLFWQGSIGVPSKIVNIYLHMVLKLFHLISHWGYLLK